MNKGKSIKTNYSCCKNKQRNKLARACLLLSCLWLSGCVGMVVGAAVDTTIEVVKIPFKVVGAAVDLAVPDGDDEEDDDD